MRRALVLEFTLKTVTMILKDNSSVALKCPPAIGHRGKCLDFLNICKRSKASRNHDVHVTCAPNR